MQLSLYVNCCIFFRLVGDLLLIEIWECITQSYKKIQNLQNKLQLKFESLRYFELLLHLNVNSMFQFINIYIIKLQIYVHLQIILPFVYVPVSLATSEKNKLPRVGEIMMLEFGPANNRHCRFFFVHNVRCLPTPQSKTPLTYN